MVATDLGLKPIENIIKWRKLKFYYRIKSKTFKGSSLVKASMEWHEGNGDTQYIKEIKGILLETGIKSENGWINHMKGW